MIQRLSDSLDEIAFHQFLLGYLIKWALLVGLGVACMVHAVAAASAWWWIGVALAALAALVLVARYNAQAVIIRGCDLVLRTGTLKVRERTFPIWQVDLELDQGLLGRLFDYATIRQRGASGEIVIHTIASARALRLLVAQRRQSVLRALAEQRRFSSSQQWELLPAP